MFSLIYAWTNGWVNTRDAGDLRRHRAHNDVTLIYRRSLEAVVVYATSPKPIMKLKLGEIKFVENIHFSRKLVWKFP